MKGFNAMVRVVALGVLMGLAGSVAAQQAYPNRLIRMIVPFPPGGTTDPLARLIAPKLAESWGRPVIIDNRAGGNTIIGTEIVVKSKPDGHTLLLLAHTNLVVPQAYGKLGNLPYDVIKDLAPVASVARTELILLVNPSLAVNNLQELIALAKSKPGQLNYAVVNVGGSLHLAMELLSMVGGIKLQVVPYKGAGLAVADLIGGHIQMYLTTPIAAFPNLNSGKLKAIAISGETRLLPLPQVPTFTEAGLPNFDPSYWYGVFAAAGTPNEIIDKLAGEIAKIIAMPEVNKKLVNQGLKPFFSGPDKTSALMLAEIAKFADVIKTANIKPATEN